MTDGSRKTKSLTDIRYNSYFLSCFHIFKSRWFSCKNEERIERENSEGYSTTCQRVVVYRCGEVASKIYH